MKLVQTTRTGKTQKYLLRGDSEGFINMWAVPEFSLEEIKQLQVTNATTKGICSQQSLVEVPLRLKMFPFSSQKYYFDKFGASLGFNGSSSCWYT